MCPLAGQAPPSDLQVNGSAPAAGDAGFIVNLNHLSENSLAAIARFAAGFQVIVQMEGELFGNLAKAGLGCTSPQEHCQR